MRSFRKTGWLFVFVAMTWCEVNVPAQSMAPGREGDELQAHVVAYLQKLSDVLCTEEVTQKKFSKDGREESTQRSSYDYLVMIQADGDTFQVNESRTAVSSGKAKEMPLLVTNGFSTLLLVFHPYYRGGFEFNTDAETMLDGRRTLPIHFAQIPGSKTPAALLLRNREYPLNLRGTAWLDAQSGEIVQMDASLMKDMTDVGLRSMTVHVEYKAAYPGKARAATMLPSLATVEVETLRQHWRNTHRFTDYKLFSVEAEQDKGVQVHTNERSKDGTTMAPKHTPEIKEKH